MRISDWSSDVCSSDLRVGADSVSDPFAAGLAASSPDRIKNDDPAGAEALLNVVIDKLSPAARAEWTQKVAWSYYIENDDANALRLATDCTDGQGAWSTQGAWVRGLASWRLHDYRTALAAFDRVAREAPDSELRAAGYYSSEEHTPELPTLMRIPYAVFCLNK